MEGIANAEAPVLLRSELSGKLIQGLRQARYLMSLGHLEFSFVNRTQEPAGWISHWTGVG